LSEMQSQGRRPALLEVIRRRLGSRVVAEHPAVPVTLEVGRRGWDLIEENKLHDDVLAQVADVLRNDMEALGIPGEPQAEMHPVPETADDDLRLRVHGRLRRLPAEQVTEILRRVTGRRYPSVSQVPAEQVGPALVAFCKATIHRQPAILLGEEQLGRYRDALGGISPARVGLGWPPSTEQLREVLLPVLDAGVGIGDVGEVAAIIAASDVDGVPSLQVAERVIDRLRLPAVHIRLNGETLRGLTTHETEPTGVFATVREQLYAESGALFPDFAFAEAAELPPGTVAFGMNALATPLTQLPDSDAFHAIADCLASELRAHRGWFISMSVVRQRLNQLKLAYPDLVSAAQDRYPTEWLTAVGRALFREEIPTPSLKETLEHLLDLGDVGNAVDVIRITESAAASTRPVIGPLPAPRDVVSYLRQRSNEMIPESFLISRQGKVLLLDAEQQSKAASLMGQSGRPGEQQTESILDAARRQIASAPGVCLAVTSVPVRSFVRELLEPEFPLVPIVATQEFGVAGAALLSSNQRSE
jgi:hypothetical protein